jgi:hypothetical protein
MGTVVLLDDEGKVAQVLAAKMALASPRAKVDKRYSPVWEGILNLRRPEPGEDAEAYRAESSSVVADWCAQYEASTGHKVLRADVHLDEGHMVDGEAVLNAHAHVIADRTNDLGRVIKLSPKQLRELQTMTAEITQLERGKSSFETGRKHISHQAYKHLAEGGRLETQQVKVKLDKSQSDLTRQRKLSKEWSDADLAKVKDLQAQLDGEPSRLADALKAQEAQLNEKYRLDRERMKQENADALAAGLAKMYSQKDYSELKKAHESALAEAAKVPALEAQITQQAEAFDKLKTDAMAVITPLRTEVKTMKTQIDQLEADKDQLAKDLAQAQAQRAAVLAENYQADRAKGTPGHLIVPDPIPRQATKTAQEQPETKNPDIPTPSQEKTLLEALRASLAAMLDWIKGAGGIQEAVGPSTLHFGPVKHMDDLHCVQKTGRRYAVHRLSELDNVPALDDPKMTIRYKDGKGIVEGRLGKSGVER